MATLVCALRFDTGARYTFRCAPPLPRAATTAHTQSDAVRLRPQKFVSGCDGRGTVIDSVIESFEYPA